MKNIYELHKVKINLGFVTGVEYEEPYKRYSTPHNYVYMKGETKSLNVTTPKQLKNGENSITKSTGDSNDSNPMDSPTKATEVPPHEGYTALNNGKYFQHDEYQQLVKAKIEALNQHLKARGTKFQKYGNDEKKYENNEKECENYENKIENYEKEYEEL